ncbi:MAG: DUF692 domain-containing protein [Gammaproteobacteria bacterium]|nr:DUF692 domain-containing protein [Gammaproteobacteria bacterium]
MHNTAFSTRERGSLAGTGIGLRGPHFEQLLAAPSRVPWLELLADNFLARGGLVPAQLQRIAAQFPVTLHCVGMNLGGVDALDRHYLERIRAIARQTDAAIISDHLCFTALNGRHYHELLPLPYNDDVVEHVAKRIRQVQDMLEQRILVENVSAYVRASSTLSEGQFIAAVAQRADCGILLDVNNLYVNQINLGTDAEAALRALPIERVAEIHLGGYEDKGRYLLDAHSRPVSDPVWELFDKAVAMLPEVPVCIEWDNDIPPLETLLAEARRATALQSRHRAVA